MNYPLMSETSGDIPLWDELSFSIPHDRGYDLLLKWRE